MTTQISNDIKEAIRKNMPELAANELKEFIQEAERMRVQIESLRLDRDGLNKEINVVRTQLEQHVPLAQREQIVDKREQEATKLELDLLRREAKIEAELAKAELGGVKNTVSQFLRLPSIRKDVLTSQPTVLPGIEGSVANGYNNPSMPSRVEQHTQSSSTTETQE